MSLFILIVSYRYGCEVRDIRTAYTTNLFFKRTLRRENVIARLDSKIEIEYYRNDGILQYVLRQFLQTAE
jgi:aconitase A